MGPSLHQTARTGHLPETKIMCEFVWSWPSIANHKALVTTEAQHTSTSGESGTVWINLVTVRMNESIWRFLRSLNATSFNSSCIYYWWQITISLCGQWLHTTTGLRDMITLLSLSFMVMSLSLASHLHFEQTAMKQAFCLFQLVELLCCRRSIQIISR